MAESARVHTLEALKQARHALATFSDDVTAALASVDADILRVSQWLSVERPTYWKLELRRREEAMQRAKGEIARKRIVAAPDPAGVSLEQRRLERAKEKVDEARRKIEKVRRWAPVWEREAMMYKASTRGLAEALHGDIPRGMAILGKMMETLEAYAEIRPPEEPEVPPREDDQSAKREEDGA